MSGSSYIERGVVALLQAALVMSWGVVTLPAQSLVEIARQEAERRKTVEPGPVYTNADLVPGRAAPLPADPDADAEGATPPAPARRPPGSTAATGDEPAEPDQPVEAEDRRDEEYWRGRAHDYAQRLQVLRDNVAAVEGRSGALAGQIEAADTDAQRTALGRQQTEAGPVLMRLRRNLASLEEEHRRFLDLARSRDVPADWLR